MVERWLPDTTTSGGNEDAVVDQGSSSGDAAVMVK